MIEFTDNSELGRVFEQHEVRIHKALIYIKSDMEKMVDEIEGEKEVFRNALDEIKVAFHTQQPDHVTLQDIQNILSDLDDKE